MMFLIIFLIAAAIGFVNAMCHKHDKALFYESFLKPIVFISIGVNGILLGFIPHVFMADAVAAKIGWPAGSPFQFEVGAHDGCWGVLGILSAWFKGGFMIATALGWSLFLLLAGYGHLRETVLNGNFAPYNFGCIAGDIVPGICILILTYLYYKHSRNKQAS